MNDFLYLFKILIFRTLVIFLASSIRSKQQIEQRLFFLLPVVAGQKWKQIWNQWIMGDLDLSLIGVANYDGAHLKLYLIDMAWSA